MKSYKGIEYVTYTKSNNVKLIVPYIKAYELGLFYFSDDERDRIIANAVSEILFMRKDTSGTVYITIKNGKSVRYIEEETLNIIDTFYNNSKSLKHKKIEVEKIEERKFDVEAKELIKRVLKFKKIGEELISDITSYSITKNCAQDFHGQKLILFSMLDELINTIANININSVPVVKYALATGYLDIEGLEKGA